MRSLYQIKYYLGHSYVENASTKAILQPLAQLEAYLKIFINLKADFAVNFGLDHYLFDRHYLKVFPSYVYYPSAISHCLS